MAIGAGCLLAGPLLMPLLSVTSSGTSAISATLQLASKFSAPALSLATGVCRLISGGVDVARDIVNYVSPNKCFNVAQSKWNDIIEYARHEHKQKCKLQNENDINSKKFIISELNAVMNAIKTEYKYFYNSNYPDGQDEDLQVVLNEYLKSLKERASKSPDNFKLYRADVYPELSTENNIQKNNIDIQTGQEENYYSNKNEKQNDNIDDNDIKPLNESAQKVPRSMQEDTIDNLDKENFLNQDNEEKNIVSIYTNYKKHQTQTLNNNQIDNNNLENKNKEKTHKITI